MLQQALQDPSISLSDLVYAGSARPLQDPRVEPLSDIIAGIIEDFPVEVKKIRGGETKVLRRLVGEAMKRTGGAADVKEINQLLNLAIHH